MAPRLDVRTALLVALLAGTGAPVLLRAQTPPAAYPAPLRIVVFQFTIPASDPGLGPLANGVAQSLVRNLTRDSAFRVMSKPRADRAPPGRPAARNAQYAVIGSVSRSQDAIRIDTRLLDIERVQLLARQTLSLNGADVTPASLAGAQLASWVHQRLVQPPTDGSVRPGAPGPK